MESLQNATSDRLCSEASCLHIWVDSRKSSENSWVKIREILLVFSDIGFNLNCSYWQDDNGWAQDTSQKRRRISTLLPGKWYCGWFNHLVCQGIYPFGNCCYVLVIYKVFSMLELSFISALLEFLECKNITCNCFFIVLLKHPFSVYYFFICNSRN